MNIAYEFNRQGYFITIHPTPGETPYVSDVFISKILMGMTLEEYTEKLIAFGGIYYSTYGVYFTTINDIKNAIDSFIIPNLVMRKLSYVTEEL